MNVKNLSSVTSFFGTQHNDRYSELMLELADTARECTQHFRKTEGKDLSGIIDRERKGDRLVDQIHEILDNSFIMRFDIPDAMTLADELDHVLDGMRKTAMHIDVYGPLLQTSHKDATHLMDMAERMVERLRDLVAMLPQSRLKLPKVLELAHLIDDDESEADKIAALAERRLVGDYSPAGANRLEFLAWQKLFTLLKEMTDHANHCAKLVVSLARKQA